MDFTCFHTEVKVFLFHWEQKSKAYAGCGPVDAVVIPAHLSPRAVEVS